ncbi:hypothetical protein ACFUGD_01835 [Streptomyces sp. NPDC057217]|uniref:hypothetical protein n=1 Tax=unclassified Streptomyces TaxID=2593676 RepID=UPI0036424FAC
MDDWERDLTDRVKDEISEWLVHQGIIPLGKIRDHDDVLDELATGIVSTVQSAYGM